MILNLNIAHIGLDALRAIQVLTMAASRQVLMNRKKPCERKTTSKKSRYDKTLQVKE
jgi:hypothetical protein